MIEARGITMHYGHKPVLNNVSVTITPKQVLAVCGPNGAGKSSLLSALTGDVKNLKHKITYDAVPLDQVTAKELAHKRAVLEQTPSLTADFTLAELIELSVPIDLPPKDTDLLVHKIINDLGLSEFKGQHVRKLSGGQRHRAHLGRVLAQLQANKSLGQDGYLFLDEPTASLDLAHQISVMKTARDISKGGSGVLVVLHDLNLAAAYADQVALMKDGHIVYLGPVNEVLTAEHLSEVYETEIIVETHKGGQISIRPSYVSE